VCHNNNNNDAAFAAARGSTCCQPPPPIRQVAARRLHVPEVQHGGAHRRCCFEAADLLGGERRHGKGDECPAALPRRRAGGCGASGEAPGARQRRARGAGVRRRTDEGGARGRTGRNSQSPLTPRVARRERGDQGVAAVRRAAVAAAAARWQPLVRTRGAGATSAARGAWEDGAAASGGQRHRQRIQRQVASGAGPRRRRRRRRRC